MTYKLKKLKTKLKEGKTKKEGNYTSKFINGEWRIIHSKNKGFEGWGKYDKKGNQIYYKDFDGLEIWKEYDEKGNIIHYKDSNDIEYWRDENRNEITKEEFNKIWKIRKTRFT